MSTFKLQAGFQTKVMTGLLALVMVASALPVQVFTAFAASTGVSLSHATLSTEIDEQVNFVVTASDDGSVTPGTYVKLDDAGAGGSFFDGTTGGACNSVTPDADDEFAIGSNKGVCYSNDTAGVYTITAQLLDGNESATTIGSPETVEITVTDSSVPVEAYENGFEVDIDDWEAYGASITRTYNGTSGVPSQCGDYHTVVDGSVFSRWGGYADTFPIGGYTTEIDVYLDMAAADGSAAEGFNFSSAISGADGNHLRDFIFHLETDATQANVWRVNVNNNSGAFPSAGAGTITETGWYTLQAYFHDNGSDELAVTMNVVKRADDSVVFTKDLSTAADVISTIVGGNRYGWFTGNPFTISSIAMDNAQLYLGAPQARVCSDATTPKTETEVDISGDTAAGENQAGWLFNRDQGTKSEFEFNTDQAQIDNGALYVLPIDGSFNGNSDKFIGEYFWLGNMAELTSFSYDFLIGAGGVAADENEFYLNVYTNFGSTAIDNYYDCKYDVAPTVGSTANWTTVTFDPTQSYPVTTRGSSPQTCPAVPAAMGADATVRMFALNTGDTSNSDAGLDGYFDNVVLETVTDITTFDFDPVPDFKPVATVLAPVNGLITNSDFDITLQATDDFDLAKMVINLKDASGGHFASCLNEAVSGTDETRSCTVDVSALGNGDYGFKANAKDNADQTSNTISQSFTVDTTKPSVQVVDPANGDVVGSDSLVTGTASDGQTEVVEVKYTVTEIDSIGGSHAGNIDNGTALGTSTWSFEPPMLPSGFYRLKVQAFDAAGNWKYDYHDVQVDADKPTVAIDYPAHTAILESGNFTATGTASDNDSGITEVKYTVTQITEIGGVYVTTIDSGVANGTENWQFDVAPLTPGFYRLKVQAFDGEGNWRYKYHDIEVIARPAASLIITNPEVDGAVVGGGEYTFAASYTDDDETVDTINWAVKGQACEANNVAVNIAGFGTSGYVPANYNHSTGQITVDYDLGLLGDGEYCFVVNPQETGGETDTDRETRTFVVKNEVAMCELEVVSDTGTLVEELNDFAVATYVHDNWTDDIANATWVWGTAQVEDPEVDTIYTFTETFTATTATSAVIEIAADNGYALYVNGTLVNDRLEQGNNHQDLAVKAYDITDLLDDGENTFTVEVKNFGTANANFMQNPAGVLYRLTLEAEEGSCAITTAPATENGNGGGSEELEEDTYAVVGFVYHDVDEDEIFTTDEQGEEDGLSGWVLTATSGEREVSTTTDETGQYRLLLPAGTWTVTLEIQSGWETTTFASFEITVPMVPETTLSFMQVLQSFFIPTAHAAVLDEYKGENFGVNEEELSGGSTTYGGYNPTNNFGQGGNPIVAGAATSEPAGVPKVLGDQVSVVPAGAPDAGHGGSVSGLHILSLLYTRRTVTEVK